MLLTRRYRFSASHRLHSERLSCAENAELYGKCNNPHGHGHNYALEVTVEGSLNPETGRVLSPGALDRFVREKVLDFLDHHDLNEDLPEFKALVPTTENLALVIGKRLCASWGECFARTRLVRVFIEETKRNSFQLELS